MEYTTLTDKAKTILLNAVEDIETRARNPIKGKVRGARGLEFDMSDWLFINGQTVSTIDELYDNPTNSICGGSCCLFGDIALRNKAAIKALKLQPEKGDRSVFINKAVQELLNITEEEAGLLYDSSEWPSPYAKIYKTGEEEGDQVLMAHALRRTVEKFIEERS